jgi:glucokinase
MANRWIISADIGGSHITAACFVEREDGFDLGPIHVKKINSRQPKDFILEEWVSLFEGLSLDLTKCCISLAMPAPFDYVNGICQIKDQGKFIHLFGVNLKDELAGRMGIMPTQIHFVNDAKAFLMGEATFGKVSKYNNILGMTLGTGLGTSLKFNGEIVDAGLWSSKFKEGIAEDYLGTGWFVNWFRQNFSIQVNGVKEIVESKDLLQMAIPAFEEFSSNLADFILKRSEEVPLDAVVIGGNIAKAHGFFLNNTISTLKLKNNQTPVFISEFGDKSALFGAASRFFDQKILLGLDQVS